MPAAYARTLVHFAAAIAAAVTAIAYSKQTDFNGTFPEGVDVGCAFFEAVRLEKLSNISTDPPISLDELWDTGIRFYQTPGATCADGEPFYFGVRRGPTLRKLHVHFTGGPYCLSSNGCCADGRPKDSLGPSLPVTAMPILGCGLSPEQAKEYVDGPELGGVFSSQYANPLLDHTLILLPFCSADLWLGGGEASYGPDCPSVNHNGSANARAVMKWAISMFGGRLDELVIVGVSGGVPGSLYHGAWMLNELAQQGVPPVRTTWIADSLVSTFYPPQQWALSRGVLADLDFLGLDIDRVKTGGDFGPIHREMIEAIANAFPCLAMAEYSPTKDDNQIRLLEVTGTNAGCQSCASNFAAGVRQYLRDSRQAVTSGQYSSCLIEDSSHTILPVEQLFGASCEVLPDSTTTQVLKWIEASLSKTLSNCNAPVPPTRFPFTTSAPPEPSEEATPAAAYLAAECFPGTATVELQSGMVVPISQLVIGDSVRVGGSEWSQVHLFGHREESSNSTFVAIELENGDEVLLSPGHLLPVKKRKDSTESLLAARLVDIGNFLWSQQNAGWTPVAHIRSQESTGLFNPHTLAGRIIVNGIAASCYTEILKQGTNQAAYFHILLLPARLLYRMTHLNVLAGIFENNRQSYVELLRSILEPLTTNRYVGG